MGQSNGTTEDISQTGQSNGTIKCGQPKTLVKWDIQRDNQVRATEVIQWDNQTGHFGYCFIFL